MQVHIGLPEKTLNHFRDKGYKPSKLVVGHLVKGNTGILVMKKSKFLSHLFGVEDDDDLFSFQPLFDKTKSEKLSDGKRHKKVVKSGIVNQMVKSFSYPIIILEDDSTIPQSQIKPYLGALASAIAMDCQVVILPSADVLLFAEKVLEKNNDNKDRGVKKKKSHLSSINSIETKLLDVLPFVGPTRAELLLNHFGSVEAVLKAYPEELKAVKGIGAVLAQKIYESLEREQVEELW